MVFVEDMVASIPCRSALISIKNAEIGGLVAPSSCRCDQEPARGCGVHHHDKRIVEVLDMGRGLLLWLLGIPLPIILVIWLLGGLS
jgi:hypothetical protein